MVTVKPVGICPACGETVKDTEDAVWTCRYDLSSDNAYVLRGSPVTYSLQKKHKDFSLCPQDHGLGSCSDHMPLHAACYDTGTW